jgi:hypothetical protein
VQPAVVLLACCFFLILLLPAILFIATYIFRVSCRLCGLRQPSVLNSAGIMFVSWVSVVIAETILRLIVEASGRAAALPQWESGIITFFLALPVDLVISSGLHAGLMGIRFGKGIEVWFVQRLIQLSIVAAIVFVAALVILAHNGN